jgi:hypothetical protein
MVLDTKAVLKAEFVSQLQLAPQLLVALGWCQASLVPHMGEMCKFHNDMISILETPTEKSRSRTSKRTASCPTEPLRVCADPQAGGNTVERVC